MSRVNIVDARKDLSELLNRALYTKERQILTRRGKDVAALVSMEDFHALEAMEDERDLRLSDAVLARIKSGDEKTVSLDEINARYKVKAGKRKARIPVTKLLR